MKAVHWVLGAALLLLFAGLTRGDVSDPPVGLDDLARQADVVFQGTAVSNTAVSDPAFEPIMGLVVQDTRFRWTCSVFDKGKSAAAEWTFRHYAGSANASGPRPFFSSPFPQSYSFEPGKSYLIFAKQPPGSSAGTCQQMWMRSRSFTDEGVLLCPRSFPFGNRGAREEFWDDLTESLKSSDANEVFYAIRHLDTYSRVSEFQHLDVMAALHGLVHHPDPTVAQAALGVIAAHSPYTARGQVQSWLATVGKPGAPGSAVYSEIVNEGGLIYWREMAALVDGKSDDATRASAVRALGSVREPSLQENLLRWLSDPSDAVRSSAVLLLADYPALATHARFVALAADEDVKTRISTAYAVGFLQGVDDLDVLTKLLSDPEEQVRQAAASSLVSFSAKDERISKILSDNLTNNEFGALFLFTLSQENPDPYLDLLIQETAKRTSSRCSCDVAHLLFRYLKALPAVDLQSGKYDSALDALESQGPGESSNAQAVDPQFVYALELKDGLTERATKLRAMTSKALIR